MCNYRWKKIKSKLIPISDTAISKNKEPKNEKKITNNVYQPKLHLDLDFCNGNAKKKWFRFVDDGDYDYDFKFKFRVTQKWSLPSSS